MVKNTIGFLKISLIAILALCIGVFLSMTNYMVRQSETAINDIGEIYMSAMSSQLRIHFESIIDLRLSQVEGIVERTPPNTVTYGEKMLEELTISAEVRSFTHLGLYRAGDGIELIYGDEMKLPNAAPFYESLNNGDKKVATAYTETNGETLVLGVPAVYPMKDGKSSTALIVGAAELHQRDNGTGRRQCGGTFPHHSKKWRLCFASAEHTRRQLLSIFGAKYHGERKAGGGRNQPAARNAAQWEQLFHGYYNWR